MALFRKKSTNPSVSDVTGEQGGWSVAQGTTDDGNALYVRLRVDLEKATGRNKWPFRIGVAVPLNSPGPDGLPGNDELKALNSIEDLIIGTAGDRAIMVAVITGSRMREFVLHARESDWIAAFHQELQDGVPTHQVQMVAEEDEAWTVYESFWN